MFSEIFMEKMAGFLKLYLPVFMLGAVFGKAIDLAGFSKSIVSSVSAVVDKKRAILAIVLVCVLLTYGGVSLFVVVFAVYLCGHRGLLHHPALNSSIGRSVYPNRAFRRFRSFGIPSDAWIAEMIGWEV
jgi:hypothetical protein